MVLSSFKVTAQDTQALRRHKRPAPSTAEPPSKEARKGRSSTGQVEVETEIEVIEGSEVVAGESDEEDGLIPMDIALPKGWKN